MEEKLNWSALEYEEKERHPDWFWALGVIVIAGALTAIIFGNYFFAIFLIVGGALMGFFAIKKPDMVFYELNNKGLKIRDRIYLYEKMKAFWVQKPLSDEGKVQPASLFVKSQRLIAPVFSVPIEEASVVKIHNLMLSHNVPEEEMKEHVSEKIMEVIGF
jgi:hypothetical protein